MKEYFNVEVLFAREKHTHDVTVRLEKAGTFGLFFSTGAAPLNYATIMLPAASVVISSYYHMLSHGTEFALYQ